MKKGQKIIGNLDSDYIMVILNWGKVKEQAEKIVGRKKFQSWDLDEFAYEIEKDFSEHGHPQAQGRTRDTVLDFEINATESKSGHAELIHDIVVREFTSLKLEEEAEEQGYKITEA